MGKLSAIAIALFFSSAAHASSCGVIPHVTFDPVSSVEINTPTLFHLNTSFTGAAFCAGSDFSTHYTSIRFEDVGILSGDGQTFQGSTALITYTQPGSYTLQGFGTFIVEGVTQSIAAGQAVGEPFTFSSSDSRYAFNEAHITILAHAPEPAAYAMMLAGLGLMGFIRRKH